MIQRELERAHEAEISLELESREGLSEERSEWRQDQLNALKKRVEEAKMRLSKYAYETAKLEADLEARQMSVQHAQQQLQSLEAADIGIKMQRDVLMRAPQAIAPKTRAWVNERAATNDYENQPNDAAQVPQLEMERDSWRLKAEALRMKAQAAKQNAATLRANGSEIESRTSEADSLLSQADASHAEAMALELAKQIEGIQA